MTPLLCVDSLTVGYETPMVHDVSFRVSGGELVGILGANGCGKTTLLRGIAGMLRRWQGTVSVCGESDQTWSVRKRAGKIAYLSQSMPVLSGVTVRSLIGMGNYAMLSVFSRPDEAQIFRCAKEVGIADLLDRDYARISAGQRQLAHLARIRMQDAAVLLLDEPNSALDFINTHRLFSIISGWNPDKKHGTVIVLHDPSLALQYCNHICLMKQGHLIAEVYPQEMSATETEQALRQLYPGICVEKSSAGTGYHCFLSAEN